MIYHLRPKPDAENQKQVNNIVLFASPEMQCSAHFYSKKFEISMKKRKKTNKPTDKLKRKIITSSLGY